MPKSTSDIEDDRLIRELLQNWAIWRDAGDWERFRTVWHPDGRMMATWTQGTGDEFIEISKQAWAKGISILHFLGGISVDLAGHRAISQTKMTISQRAEVEGVLCDVLCTGRFYDFLEKREGAGASCCASRSMRRTAWTRSRRARRLCWTRRCSSSFRRATGTSLICRPASAIPSSATCPA